MLNFFQRLTQFCAIIIISTILCAGLFALGDYVEQYGAEQWQKRDDARERVKNDSPKRMRSRAILGAVVGAGFSTLYVLRCLLKGDEP